MLAPSLLATLEDSIHVNEFNKHIVINPCLTAAALVPSSAINPVEKLVAAILDSTNPMLPEYPDISTPPASPSWTITFDVPFVLTPLNITVIRLGVKGAVKSTLVCVVKTTAVPEVIAAVDTFHVLSPRKNVLELGVPVALNCVNPTVAALGTPTKVGKPKNNTPMLLVPDVGALVNVSVAPDTE
jgi:hypothetical protein